MSRALELAGLVTARLSGGQAAVSESMGEVTLTIPREHVLEALRVLHASPDGPPVLTDLTALDWYPKEPRFEVIYLLTWYESRSRLRVKARVTGVDPAIASVTPWWAAANWLEREVYDMFGIRFEGHPELTRILMPDDWEGHPLRKDFPLTEEPVQFIDHTPRLPSQIIPKSAPRS